MAAIDFITALGRVLHDGALRDAFAADAPGFVQQLGLRAEDHAAFLKLVPADLEFQARVLLHKRFDLARQFLPRTCQQMNGAAWEEFGRYGRSKPPTGKNHVVEEAFGFGQYLSRVHPEAVCQREINRCRFTLGHRRLSVHVVKPLQRRRLPSLQVLLRRRSNHWQEWLVYLGC